MVLQLGLAERLCFLWAEGPLPTVRRAPRTSSSRTIVSPRAIDTKPLVETMTATVGPSASRWLQASQILWLPTSGDQPLPCHPLLGEPPAGRAKIELHPWQVPVCALGATDAMELLTLAGDRETLAPGVVVGTTITYWAAVLRWAGALVSRGQFLPTLTKIGPFWQAIWRPVISGSDREQFHRMAAAMPPVCRAVGERDRAPERPGAEVLTEFLGVVVDALVRASRPKLAGAGSRDSLHDHWVAALRSPSPTLKGNPEELALLARQISDWQRPIAVTAEAPFHLTFRLVEPSAEAAPSRRSPSDVWTLQYLLQAADDPSLLIPLADAWTPKRKLVTAVGSRGLPSREFLLTSLGQAAKISKEVAASLKSVAPDHAMLSTQAANEFLTLTSAVLQQSGFGVLLPAWWARTGTKSRLSLTAEVRRSGKSSSVGAGVLALEEIVSFQWRIALGEIELTHKELEALAKLKEPLVQVRGQWVQVNAEEIQAALAYWKAHPKQEASVREIIQMSLGAAEGPGGLRVRGVRATGWLQSLLESLHDHTHLTELPPPAGFHGTLRPYQQRGYSWLSFLRQWGLGACLADDMGLGKTIQALATLQHARESGEYRPFLLVCPTSVVGNWKKEAERFTPELPVLVHHGTKRSRGDAFARQVSQAGLVIVSFGLLVRDLALLQAVRWAGVILDEAQIIKNPTTKQAQAARSLTSESRIALTGTPVENHLGDLWSIWQFLNPGFLGSRESFRQSFLVPIQVQGDDEAANRLRQMTGPFLLRRLKTDKQIIADLPEKLENKVYCTMTKEQGSLYAAVVRDLESSLKGEDGIRRKGMILGTLSKLKQICNHPAQFLGDNSEIPGRSMKLARLTEMLDEVIQAGERALVFSQFTEMGEILKRYLQETFGREVLFLHGGVPAKQRDKMVSRFQDESHRDAPRIFLISLKAGGTGLNLTAASHVFHFDRWWNPAVENQATDRAFRIGQRRNVQVHKFVCVGTLEEKIDEMIELKQALAQRVIGSGEGWLTQLTDHELRDILMLRANAVEE